MGGPPPPPPSPNRPSPFRVPSPIPIPIPSPIPIPIPIPIPLPIPFPRPALRTLPPKRRTPGRNRALVVFRSSRVGAPANAGGGFGDKPSLGYRVRLAFIGSMIDTPTPANRGCRKRLSLSVTFRSALKSAPDGLSVNA